MSFQVAIRLQYLSQQARMIFTPFTHLWVQSTTTSDEHTVMVLLYVLSLRYLIVRLLAHNFYSLFDSFVLADREYADDDKFHTFRRQLFHTSIAHIFRTLRKGMTTPQVKLCADGHYRRVIYSLGPYIADYPEQVLLACVVNNWCPK